MLVNDGIRTLQMRLVCWHKTMRYQYSREAPGSECFTLAFSLVKFIFAKNAQGGP